MLEHLKLERVLVWPPWILVAYLIINWRMKELAKNLKIRPSKAFFDTISEHLSAYLIKDKFPPKEIASPILNLAASGIGISLDGLAATHDRLRGLPGLFDHVIAGISVVLKSGLPLTVITTVNSRNVVDLPQLTDILAREGVCSWQIQPIFHLGRGAANADLQLSEEQFLELGDVLAQCGPAAAKARLEIMPGDSFGYFTQRDTREPEWQGCPAGRYSCGITSDGKVKGCLSLPDECVEGDL